MKEKSKRSILAIVILVFAIMLFSSCGEKKEEHDSFDKVKIEGSIGVEPKVTIPKDYNPTDEAFGFLREGNGEIITNKDEVSIHIQKIGTNEPDTIYSTWNEGKPQISIDLQEAYKDQVPEDLRKMLIGAKVGAVFVYATTDTVSELTDGAKKSTKKVKQVWIISVVSKIKATIVTENPNKVTTDSGVSKSN